MFTIKYTFNDGTSREDEVNEKIYLQHLILERQERLSDRRETRRHNSLYGMLENGSQFEAVDDNPLISLIKKEDDEALHKAINFLKPCQRELIIKVFYEDKSLTEIAQEEGVSQPAITQRLATIYKKLKKLL